MKRNLDRIVSKASAAAAFAAFMFVTTLCAQDPFGGLGPRPAVDNQPPEAAEAQAKGDAVPQQPADKAAETAKAQPPPDPSRYSLPVRAVLESDPQTPRELVRAASVLVDLDEPALARPYMLKLQQAALDDRALADLVRQLGSRPFLNIAGEKALEPEGSEFGDRAIVAASQRARDPARLAQLVKQLGDPSAETQRRAIAELLGAHEFAVPPLLAALNDPAKTAVHAQARITLAALGEDAVAPLLAALDGPDSAGKVAAIVALGRMRAAEATARLVGLSVSPAVTDAVRTAAENALVDLHGKTAAAREAADYLEKEAREVLSGKRFLATNIEGNVEGWIWDAAKEQPVPATISANQAQSQLALCLARRLIELSPDNWRYRRLYVVSLLEAEAYRVGRDNPVPRGEGSAFTEAAETGAAAVDDALEYALVRGHVAAATVAAEVLAEIGGSGLLAGGSQPSPLARALTHEDQRLRFAASQAIVKLEPTMPFAGLSHLKSALVSFATSAGQRRAVVGFPNVEIAQKLVGIVNSLGFASDTATNGRELSLKATRPGDSELILISSRIDRGPLYQVLQDLRKHARTAETPIIVLAEDEELDALRDRLRDDPLTTVVLRPRSVEAMKYAIDSVLRRAGERIVPPDVHQRQAEEALRSIAELTARAPKVFDFRDDEKELSPLLYVPSLGPLAAEVLADFGTHTSQQSLLAITNRTSQPLATRQAAALAFGQSVRRFGVRLTSGEILQQYDRYNQSEFEDKASQDLLGAVLDAIELPTRMNGE